MAQFSICASLVLTTPFTGQEFEKGFMQLMGQQLQLRIMKRFKIYICSLHLEEQTKDLIPAEATPTDRREPETLNDWHNRVREREHRTQGQKGHSTTGVMLP